MILVQITGGLGNQMFQYALICALKKTYPSQEIKVDITDYELVHAHTGYCLEKYFQISLPVASVKEIEQICYIPTMLKRPEIEQGLKRIWKILQYRLVVRKNSEKRPFTVTDYEFNAFNSSVFSLNTEYDWYLKGYWQNKLYFSSLIPELKKIFQFKRLLNQHDQEIAKRMQIEEAVFIHIRRGDYVNTVFDLCNMSYYLKAKKEIEKRIKTPGTL